MVPAPCDRRPSSARPAPAGRVREGPGPGQCDGEIPELGGVLHACGMRAYSNCAMAIGCCWRRWRTTRRSRSRRSMRAPSRWMRSGRKPLSYAMRTGRGSRPEEKIRPGKTGAGNEPGHAEPDIARSGRETSAETKSRHCHGTGHSAHDARRRAGDRDRRHAKPYQVRQVRQLVLKYRLGGDD